MRAGELGRAKSERLVCEVEAAFDPEQPATHKQVQCRSAARLL